MSAFSNSGTNPLNSLFTDERGNAVNRDYAPPRDGSNPLNSNPLNSIPTVKKKRPVFEDYFNGPRMDPYGTSPNDPENVKRRQAWHQGWTQYQADLKAYDSLPENRPGAGIDYSRTREVAAQMQARHDEMLKRTANEPGWTKSLFAQQHPRGYFWGSRTLPQGNM